MNDRDRGGLFASAWAAWDVYQRTAAIAAGFLIVSTLGPFSFVEAALILVAGAVLWLLTARGAGMRFALPLADGTLLAAAGAWSGFLIATRVFDRPLGQNLLALSCAGLLVLSGLLARGQPLAPRSEKRSQAAGRTTPSAPR